MWLQLQWLQSAGPMNDSIIVYPCAKQSIHHEQTGSANFYFGGSYQWRLKSATAQDFRYQPMLSETQKKPYKTSVKDNGINTRTRPVEMTNDARYCHARRLPVSFLFLSFPLLSSRPFSFLCLFHRGRHGRRRIAPSVSAAFRLRLHGAARPSRQNTCF